MNIPAVWIAYERKRIVNGESQTERGWVNEAGLCTPMSVSDGNEKSFQDLCWTSEARLAKTPTASTPKPAYIFPLGPQSKVEWAVEILMSVTALTPSWGWEEEAISWVFAIGAVWRALAFMIFWISRKSCAQSNAIVTLACWSLIVTI